MITAIEKNRTPIFALRLFSLHLNCLQYQYCLSTFHGLCPPDINIDAIYIFLDGCPDESMQAGHQTFQSLVSIMELHVSEPMVFHVKPCGGEREEVPGGLVLSPLSLTG